LQVNAVFCGPCGDPLGSGYNLARVRFEIIFAPSAVRELRALLSHERSEVRDAIETHLRFEPTKLSRSRIKRLRGLDWPQFRLRVGEIRVFYDVTEIAVEILAIVSKAQTDAWLKEKGTPISIGGSGQSEG
jgi:mRNA interferase RelE/StbE